MEIKDLILLLLVPIVLISTIIYVGEKPVITGAAISELKENNIFGTYSILPSFKTKIQYDLNDYNTINDLLGIIKRCMENGNSIDFCMKKDEIKNSNFKWELNCDKGAEKVIYDLAEFYQDCFDSDDNNCLCSKNVKLQEEELKKYDLSNKQYQIILEQNTDLKKISIKMKEPNIDLSYDIKISSKYKSTWYPNTIVLAYILNKVELIFKNVKGETLMEREEYIYSLPPDKKEIIIYKSKTNNLDYVDFVKQENDNLKYPNDEVVVDSSKTPIDIKNLHPCQIKPKNIFKFCVTKKDYKIMAYDKEDGKVMERPVTIKFASYIADQAPPSLANVKVYDRPKAEKSVLMKWDRSTADDVAKYRIYYTQTSDVFEKTKTEELIKNNNVMWKDLDLNNAELIDDVTNPAECEFDYFSRKCMFSTANGKISLDNDKLYYSKSTNSYLYALNIPNDDVEHDFTVTAIDQNNNEIDNSEKQKLPVIKSKKSIDDLPPDSGQSEIVLLGVKPIYDSSTKQFSFSFTKITAKNLDGTELKDFKDMKIYYMKYDKLSTQEEERNAVKEIMELALKDLKIADVTDKKEKFIQIALSENLQPNNVVYFVIVAYDNNDNPKSEQFNVKELGTAPIGTFIT